MTALIQVLPGLGFSPTLDEDDYIPESVEAVVYGPLESFADDLEADETADIHLNFTLEDDQQDGDAYDSPYKKQDTAKCAETENQRNVSFDEIPEAVESDSLSDSSEAEENKDESASSSTTDDDTIPGYNHAALVQAILEETESTDEEDTTDKQEIGEDALAYQEQQQEQSVQGAPNLVQSATNLSVLSSRSAKLQQQPLPSILRTSLNKDQPKSVSFKGVTMHIHAVGLGDCPWVQNGLPTALTSRRLSSKKYTSTQLYEREQEQRKERRRAKRAASSSSSPKGSPKSVTQLFPDGDTDNGKKNKHKSSGGSGGVRRMSSTARRELLRTAGYTEEQLLTCLEQVYELKKDMLLHRPAVKRKGRGAQSSSSSSSSSILQHQDSLEALQWLDCICAAPDQPMSSSSSEVLTIDD